MNGVATVLIVEDDARLRVALRATFRAQSFAVVEAATGEAGLLALAQQDPDLVLLDLKLPGLDGVQTLREIRRYSDVPVIVLTVRSELDDKLGAFEAGADDYMVKPFEPDELIARVRVHMRRGPSVTTAPRMFHSGDMEFDLDQRLVTISGEPVHLTQLEYRVLDLLASNPGRLMTHAEIIDSVWGARNADGKTRLRATVLSLRRKLNEDVADPRLIFTEPGLGYRWIGAQDVVADGPLE